MGHTVREHHRCRHLIGPIFDVGSPVCSVVGKVPERVRVGSYQVGGKIVKLIKDNQGRWLAEDLEKTSRNPRD